MSGLKDDITLITLKDLMQMLCYTFIYFIHLIWYNRLIIMFKIIQEIVNIQTEVTRTGDRDARDSNNLYQPEVQKNVYKLFFLA
jgi:hypothetical protein